MLFFGPRSATPHDMAEKNLQILPQRDPEQGAIGYILAWLLGIPIPILIIIFLVRGCN